MPLTFAQLLSAELYIEPAAIQVMEAAGYAVLSGFLPVDANGNPVVAAAKDEQCFVAFDMGSDEGGRFVFQGDTDRPLVSVPAAWRGSLRITHRVAMGDEPPPAGKDPACYKRLLIQRGEIRALFLKPENPLQALLPQYDFLSILLMQPDRRVEQDRFANQATEIFDLRFTATDDLPAQP